MAGERWILDWQDRSGDADRRILVSLDSIEEVRERIKIILDDQTWTPPNSDAEVNALQAFQDEALDLTQDSELLGLWEGVDFECDDGSLHVERER